MKLLFLTLAVCYPFVAVSQVVHCFDVGQGNCTLVYHNNHALKIPVLLIDGGSKAYQEFRGATFKTDQIKKISDTIWKYAQAVSVFGIDVVVSHPDEDHYNWIPEIIAGCTKDHPEMHVRKIVLGGTRDLYNADFKDFLTAQAEADAEIVFPTFEDLTKVRTPLLLEADRPFYSIMPALTGVTKGQKNQSSLVVLIEDPKIKMMIMGDGTEQSTTHIMAHDEEIPRGAFLHASHHGADTHGCNNVDWFDRLQPCGIVFSSGVNKGLRHPRGAIIRRSLDRIPTDDSALFYPLYYGVDDAKLRCYARGTQNYGLTAVRENIRGTLSQGTILYVYNPGTAKVDAHCERPEASANPKECILKALIKFPRGLLMEDHLTHIDISELERRDDEAKDSDRAFVHALLDSLAAKAGLLKELLMHNNYINTRDSIAKIIDMLLRRKNIVSINISDNRIEPDLQKYLRDQLVKQPTTKIVI